MTMGNKQLYRFMIIDIVVMFDESTSLYYSTQCNLLEYERCWVLHRFLAIKKNSVGKTWLLLHILPFCFSTTIII